MVIEEATQLTYDLRQEYAKQLGEIRLGILLARKDHEYKAWAELLDSLYIEISTKLNVKDANAYVTMVDSMNEIINANSKLYHEGKDIPKLYSALRKINIWLNKKMDEYKMFGAKETFDGL